MRYSKWDISKSSDKLFVSVVFHSYTINGAFPRPNRWTRSFALRLFFLLQQNKKFFILSWSLKPISLISRFKVRRKERKREIYHGFSKRVMQRTPLQFTITTSGFYFTHHQKSENLRQFFSSELSPQSSSPSHLQFSGIHNWLPQANWSLPHRNSATEIEGQSSVSTVRSSTRLQGKHMILLTAVESL